MRKGEYQGHHCWNCWNVSLWIGNDEGLYRFALECKRRTANRAEAVSMFLEAVGEKTPDGGRYTKTAVARAMVGL